jgi:hypothetical protein
VSLGITADPTVKLIANFKDQNGKVSKMITWMLSSNWGVAGTAVIQVIAALTNLSNAALLKWEQVWQGTVTGYTPGTATLYPTAADKGYIVFRSSAGARINFNFPAPIDAIVSTSDTTELLPASTALAALLTGIAANCQDAAGNSIVNAALTQRRHSAHVKTQVPGAA